MAPITLITVALAMGAIQEAGEVSSDAYKKLKALIQKKFLGKPSAEAILEEYEKDPATYDDLLKKNLVEVGAEQDEEILKAAQELLKQLETQEIALGKFNLNHIQVSAVMMGCAGISAGISAEIIAFLAGDPTTDAPPPRRP